MIKVLSTRLLAKLALRTTALCFFLSRRGFGSLGLLFVVLLWAPSLSAKIRVGTVPWAGFSALNVADAKGFWKAQNLEVEVSVFASNQQINAALLEGEIDVALDMLGSWVGMYEGGHDIVILGESDWSHGGDKVIAKVDFDPQALKGQTVGIYLNQPSVTVFLDRFLRSQHLELSAIVLLEQEPAQLADSFIAGKVPVIVNYDPQAMRAVSEGNGRVFASSASYPGIIPEGFAALRPTWARFSDDEKLKFWLGVLRAVAWLESPQNWDEYQRILNQLTFPTDPDFSEAELRSMVNAVTIHTPAKLLERNARGAGMERYLDELALFLRKNQQLKRPFSFEQIVDNQSFIAAMKEFDK